MQQLKRHIDRRETLAHWPARDVDSGENMGLVTDLSEDGVRIHSRHEFTQGQLANMRISVSRDLLGTDHVILSVENVWCHRSSVPGLFQAGFKIVHITPQVRADLRKLIDTFSYAAPDGAES